MFNITLTVGSLLTPSLMITSICKPVWTRPSIKKPGQQFGVELRKHLPGSVSQRPALYIIVSLRLMIASSRLTALLAWTVRYSLSWKSSCGSQSLVTGLYCEIRRAAYYVYRTDCERSVADHVRLALVWRQPILKLSTATTLVAQSICSKTVRIKVATPRSARAVMTTAHIFFIRE